MLSRALNAGVFEDRDAASTGPEADDSNNHGDPYEVLVVPPTSNHRATVIWLHGLGGTNKDILHYVDEVSDLPGLDHIKFILPQARSMPVTGNHNYVMPSWFDCYSFDIENRDEDVEGQKQASDLINDIITQEYKEWGIPSSRVVVGGLSQGSAVALHVALTTQRPLGGAFVLSGYVPQRTSVAEIASPLSKTLPYFWGHGRRDTQVRYPFSLESARTLASDLEIEMVEVTTERVHEHADWEDPGEVEPTRAKMEFFGYPSLVHWMSSEEMDDLAKWLREVVPRSSAATTTT